MLIKGRDCERGDVLGIFGQLQQTIVIDSAFCGADAFIALDEASVVGDEIVRDVPVLVRPFRHSLVLGVLFIAAGAAQQTDHLDAIVCEHEDTRRGEGLVQAFEDLEFGFAAAGVGCEEQAVGWV